MPRRTLLVLTMLAGGFVLALLLVRGVPRPPGPRPLAARPAGRPVPLPPSPHATAPRPHDAVETVRVTVHRRPPEGQLVQPHFSISQRMPWAVPVDHPLGGLVLDAGHAVARTPRWLQRAVESTGWTPGQFTGRLASVDPWLAAAAVRAEQGWEARRYFEAYERASADYEARYGEGPYDATSHDAEAEAWWEAHRPEEPSARVDQAYDALASRFPDHPATDMATLTWLSTRGWEGDRVATQLERMARTDNPEVVADVAAFTTAWEPHRQSLSPEHLDLLEEVALSEKAPPEARGQTARVVLQYAHHAGDHERVARMQAAYDAAADACARAWPTPSETEDFAAHQCAAVREMHRILTDQRLVHGELPPRTWQEALGAAAHRCAWSLPTLGFAPLAGSGRFEERWAWVWADPLHPLAACLADGVPNPLPPEGTVIRLEVTTRP